MTRTLQAVRTAGCIAVVFLMISCKKDFQPVVQENALAPKADKELKKCDIVKINSYDRNLVLQQVVTFEYNKKGDPVSVTPSLITTGSPKLLFRYDDKNRLTDFIGVYANAFFEYWHKYGHDKHKRVTTDTMYIFGRQAEGAASGVMVGITHYDYDLQGRIIKMTTQSPVYGTSSVTLEYDANGNLVAPGITYDDQVSLFRTNEIWMFLFRTYSRNNVLAASAYNSAGLPLAFNAAAPPYFMFSSWQLNNSVIEYECKGN